MTEPSDMFRERVRELAQRIHRSRGNIISEFAKVCPTTNSFSLMQKNTHRVWDDVCDLLAKLCHFVDDTTSIEEWRTLLLNDVRNDKQ